jgi:hypothetical protein
MHCIPPRLLYCAVYTIPIMTEFKSLIKMRAGSSGRPRGLRRGSAADRLLRLWVRIPLGHGCLSVVSVVCCQVEVSATS